MLLGAYHSLGITHAPFAADTAGFRPPHYDSTSPSDKMEAEQGERRKANFPIKHSFRLIWLRKVGAICSLRESVIDSLVSLIPVFHLAFLVLLVSSRKSEEKNKRRKEEESQNEKNTEKKNRGKLRRNMTKVGRWLANWLATHSSNSQTCRTAVAGYRWWVSQLDPSLVLIRN